jgi:hypothetical protein
MAPKKLTTKELNILANEHGIQFMGPVPPSLWPDRCSHLFRVIYDISSLRFEEYDGRTDLNPRFKKDQSDRVKALRVSAREQRRDVNSNEDTWRASTEAKVVMKFDGEIVW